MIKRSTATDQHSASHVEKQLPLTLATLTSSSSSSSPRCVPFTFCRGGERRSRGLPHLAAAAGGTSAGAGCGRPLCRAAEVVGGGIRGAFFVSLDWCSCVEVGTKHDDSFRMLDAVAAGDPEAAPLIMRGGAPSSGDDDSAAAAAAAGSHGRRRRKGNKQRRGGLGCCDANSTSTVSIE